MDAQTIKAALRKLNPDNDDHWTATGKPDVSAVNDLIGGDEKVSRADINEADADFGRGGAPRGGDTETASAASRLAARTPPDLNDRLNDPGPALDAAGRGALPPGGGSTVERNQNAIFEKESAEMQGDTTRANPSADIGSGPGGADRNLALAQRRSAQQNLDDPKIAAARRAAVEAQLGPDDERVGALSESRPDLTGHGLRVRSREERMRTSDRERTLRSKSYVAASKIAAEEGAPAAPDWVEGKDIITLDRRYYGGRIYEKNAVIRQFVGRIPARAILA